MAFRIYCFIIIFHYNYSIVFPIGITIFEVAINIIYRYFVALRAAIHNFLDSNIQSSARSLPLRAHRDEHLNIFSRDTLFFVKLVELVDNLRLR